MPHHSLFLGCYGKISRPVFSKAGENSWFLLVVFQSELYAQSYVSEFVVAVVLKTYYRKVLQSSGF